jgi:uncharacterized beta-barrel protein YwiB (DUF1934 family)
MKQSYIEIFENTGGNITMRYAMPSDGQTLDVQTIEINREDLLEISNSLFSLDVMGGE